jgi:hypothetical protein
MSAKIVQEVQTKVSGSLIRGADLYENQKWRFFWFEGYITALANHQLITETEFDGLLIYIQEACS